MGIYDNIILMTYEALQFLQLVVGCGISAASKIAGAGQAHYRNQCQLYTTMGRPSAFIPVKQVAPPSP